MDDKKVPVITKDEAISKLRMFQSVIASENWEDKVCVVALQMGIRAIQQPEIIRCKDCKRWTSPSFGYKNAQVGDCRILGATHADWFCADGERKEGDGE